MLNRLLMVWIVYAGAMGFAVGGSFVAAYQTTLPHHETSAAAEQSTSDQEAKEKPEQALARYTLWLTVFTGVLAFATVGLGIATVGLYAAGEKQFGLARDEFIATHRPRIVLKDVSYINGQIFYMLANIGATKATIVESWIFDELLMNDVPIRPLRSVGHDMLGRLTFEGGQVWDLLYQPNFSAFMRVPDLKRIGSEERPSLIGSEIYFTGAILYEDGAGIRRRSIFRRRWVDDRDGFVRMKDERDHEYAD
jgi:hypothetical protein